MYIPPLSRVRARARFRRFSTFVFTSSQIPFKTLCINGLRVKDSPLFPSHLPSPKVLGVYVLCTFHAKRRDLAATARNEGGDWVERSKRRRTKWTKGEGKGGVKPSPLMRYRSRSWKKTMKSEAFTRNSLSISRLQGKGEEVKVVFRKQLMRTRARKGGRKVRKVRRFSRIGHGFVLSTSKCNKSGSSDIWSDAALKRRKPLKKSERYDAPSRRELARFDA